MVAVSVGPAVAGWEKREHTTGLFPEVWRQLPGGVVLKAFRNFARPLSHEAAWSFRVECVGNPRQVKLVGEGYAGSCSDAMSAADRLYSEWTSERQEVDELIRSALSAAGTAAA